MSAASNRAATCNMIVDLPIPGSPPTSTIEPGTMPPPKTKSNSSSPVRQRAESTPLTAPRRCVSTTLPGIARAALRLLCGTFVDAATSHQRIPRLTHFALPSPFRGLGATFRASKQRFRARHQRLVVVGTTHQFRSAAWSEICRPLSAAINAIREIIKTSVVLVKE